MSGANKYTVHTRLAMLENAVTELKKENAELRTHLKGALETAVNDAKNIIQSSQAADFRDLQVGIGKAFSELKASVKNGVDGRDGATGSQGPRGDVLIPNETELQQAVIDLRRKLKEQHAKFIAVLVENIEGHNKGTKTGRHFAKLLESIKQEIERLG
jgi:hypothetical protein